MQSVIDSGITYPTDDGLDLSEYIETSAFISDYVNDVAVANSLSSSESLDLFASSLQAVVKKYQFEMIKLLQMQLSILVMVHLLMT